LSTDPFDSGMLDVGDGQRIFWELAGNASGRPAVTLHGGLGSGSSPGMRRLLDPTRCLIAQFDQRWQTMTQTIVDARNSFANHG
jgi:proline iminopeptidase